MAMKPAIVMLMGALAVLPLSAQVGTPSNKPVTSDVGLPQTSTSFGAAIQIPKTVAAIQGFVNPVLDSKLYVVEVGPGESLRATLAHPHGGVFLSGKTPFTGPGPRLGRSKKWTEFKNTSATSLQLFLTVKDEEHWTSQESPYTLTFLRHP